MGGTAALILAAGSGSRMKSGIPKQFMKINGKPLFLYSVEKFLLFTDRVTVVTGEDQAEECGRLLREAGLSERVGICIGGAERFESSYRGLQSLLEDPPDRVLIHDAARACVDPDTIRRVLSETEISGAAVAAVPSKDTIRISDEQGFVRETPKRALCWIIQTPQGFSYDLLLRCYEELGTEKMRKLGITDDAMVVEQASGHPIKLVPGDYGNVKVTTPEDLIYAEGKLR